MYRHDSLIEKQMQVKEELGVYGGFPGGLDSGKSTCNAGDGGSIPGLGRSPGEGNGDPLLCSCLENSMDRRAWWATVSRRGLTAWGYPGGGQVGFAKVTAG